MNTIDSPSTIKSARLFSIVGAIFSALLALISAAGALMTASDILIGDISQQDIVCIVAFILTVIFGLILVSCIEKVSLFSKLLENEQFLKDVDDQSKGDAYFFGLWKEQGGYTIEEHMKEIRAPKEDCDDLFESHNKTAKAYLKLTSKVRKAVKAGSISLWFAINGIIEAYDEWHDETWSSASSYIAFYTQAYEKVTDHDQIPERLQELKLELVREFVEDEASDGSMINIPSDERFYKFFLVANAIPNSAFEADAQVEMMRHIDETADEEIETAISSAYSSGEAAGMSHAMMANAMANMSHNLTHHHK